MKYLTFAFWLVLAAAPAAFAVEPDEMLADPALEARAREISRDLRCVVCQNQNIDTSNAGVARDLRLLVRERLTAGDSDTEVIDFVTARYGDYVLLRPPFAPRTYALWLAPVGLVLIAVAIGAVVLARSRRLVGGTALTEAEESEVARLLAPPHTEDPS
ncbi:cytochrome C biogenesis protein [Roseivivax marinus]|uniref:Cytochrome c-type biogenesis protein n=1 Tax=Roseivivax marinus TaxID=1379903 RepID=W4HEL1_9RHOB|nr:cytochrome c-type biogenesis protein [Roseivivax marinus]ETW11212.1 cytochrome C biogenesis protein [Roseivivax marinus]